MFLNIEHRKFGPHNREQCVSVEFSLLMGHLQLSCWDSPNSAASLLKINNNVSCPLTNHRLMLAWTLGLQMDGIHPKFVLSKRFPVHAAIEQLNLHALKVSENNTRDQQVSRWCSGSLDSDLRRQIPFWSEVDQHRHLRAAPSLHQPASLWAGNPGHCEALYRSGSSCQWSGLYRTNSTVLCCQECFDKRVLLNESFTA